MSDPTNLQRFIDPVRHPPEGAGETGMALVAGAAMLVAAAWAAYRVLRKFGKPDGVLTARDALPGALLAGGLLVLPPVLAALWTGGDAAAFPLEFGVVQALSAIACIFVLAINLWAGPDAPARDAANDWLRLDLTRLPRVLLLWLLAYPLLQGAMLISVSLLAFAEVPIKEQGVIEQLRRDDSARWIAGWYVLAVVAAPLAEEFIFRVVLFGGVRRWLAAAGGWAPWVAGAVSIGVFVLAHEVWNYPVIGLPLTLLAVLLTLCYAHTRSIWPGVIIHALHNGLVVTLQFFVVE